MRDDQERTGWTRVKALVGDWGEVVVYAGIGLLLFVVIERAGQLDEPLGWALLGVGFLVLYRLFRSAYVDGLLRRGTHEGPGVVSIDERRIAYLSADEGGVVALATIRSVAIRTTADGPFTDDLFWEIEADAPGGGVTRLSIPGSAVGAEGLLGALTGLPGFDHEAVVRAMGSTQPARFDLWRRATTEPAALS